MRKWRIEWQTEEIDMKEIFIDDIIVMCYALNNDLKLRQPVVIYDFQLKWNDCSTDSKMPGISCICAVVIIIKARKFSLSRINTHQQSIAP